MTNTAQPRLNEETLSELRLYAETGDDGEMVYAAVWAVHGEGDSAIEYPLTSYADDMTVSNSADPEYGEINGQVLDEEWYRFFAGQFVRLMEEGGRVLEDMWAFAPEGMDHIEVWGAQSTLLMLQEGSVPYEVEWAIHRGLELIDEDVDFDVGELGEDDE